MKILAYIYVVAFSINLIGNSFIDKYGIIAASYSTLLAYLSILILLILYIKRGINE